MLRLTVILDANILFPAPLRDFLCTLGLLMLPVAVGLPKSKMNGHEMSLQNAQTSSQVVCVYELFQLEPQAIILAMQTLQTSLKNPPKSMLEVLVTLEQQGMTQTVRWLREFFAV